MLTSQALNRTTDAYRRGYNDGGYGEPYDDCRAKKGTFRREDYREGFKAGVNDRYWGDNLGKGTQEGRAAFLASRMPQAGA